MAFNRKEREGLSAEKAEGFMTLTIFVTSATSLRLCG